MIRILLVGKDYQYSDAIDLDEIIHQFSKLIQKDAPMYLKYIVRNQSVLKSIMKNTYRVFFAKTMPTIHVEGHTIQDLFSIIIENGKIIKNRYYRPEW